jgi:hypothetical protein
MLSIPSVLDGLRYEAIISKIKTIKKIRIKELSKKASNMAYIVLTDVYACVFCGKILFIKNEAMNKPSKNIKNIKNITK